MKTQYSILLLVLVSCNFKNSNDSKINTVEYFSETIKDKQGNILPVDTLYDFYSYTDSLADTSINGIYYSDFISTYAMHKFIDSSGYIGLSNNNINFLYYNSRLFPTNKYLHDNQIVLNFNDSIGMVRTFWANFVPFNGIEIFTLVNINVKNSLSDTILTFQNNNFSLPQNEYANWSLYRFSVSKSHGFISYTFATYPYKYKCMMPKRIGDWKFW